MLYQLHLPFPSILDSMRKVKNINENADEFCTATLAASISKAKNKVTRVFVE